MTKQLLLLTDDEALIEIFQSLDGFDVHVSKENWYVEPTQTSFDVAIADLDWVRLNGNIFSALKTARTAFGIASPEKLPLSKSTTESFHDIWIRPLHPTLLSNRIEKGIEYHILSNSKSEFAKYVPWQISQNAYIIAGYSDVMLSVWEGQLGEKYTVFANQIYNRAKQILRLVAMFRDVVPIATQTTPFEPRNVTVSEVILELRNHHIMQHHRQEGNNLLLDIPDELPCLFTDLNSLINALWLLFMYALSVNSQNDRVTLSIEHNEEQGVNFAITGIRDNTQENTLEDYLEQLYLNERHEEEQRKCLASALALIFRIGSWLKMKKETQESLTFHFTLPIAKDTPPT